MNDKCFFFSTLTDDATFSCVIGSIYRWTQASQTFSFVFWTALYSGVTFSLSTRFKCKLFWSWTQTQRHNISSITPQQIAFFIADKWCNDSLLWQVLQISLNVNEPDLFICILYRISMRLWVIASDFRKCGSQYIYFKVVGQNEVLRQISGMEVSVDSIIKMPFCSRNYNEKLEIAKAIKSQYQNWIY